MNVPIDITGVQLETENTILRPTETDLEDLNEYAKVRALGNGGLGSS